MEAAKVERHRQPLEQVGPFEEAFAGKRIEHYHLQHTPAQNQYMPELILGELSFARMHAEPVFALAQVQKIVLRNHFPHLGEILGGIHFGANTCRACIRTFANTEQFQANCLCTGANYYFQQTRVYPYPLGAGSARPNPKMGAPDPENPLFLGFSVLGVGLRPWSRKGPDHGVGVDPETFMLA